MPPVRIPAAAANRLTVPVCARHGRPAAGKPMVFTSRPPAWTLLLLLLGGGLVYLIVANYVRKEVFAPAWPWCRRCDLARLWRPLAGLALFVAGAKLALTYSDAVHGPAAFAVILATVSLMITGWVLITLGTRAASAGVRVSRDGEWLDLPHAHPLFIAALQSQPAPSYPMPQGWTVPAAAPHWTPAPVPVAEPPAAVSLPSDGWASPSA
jgi:hypothetical protein